MYITTPLFQSYTLGSVSNSSESIDAHHSINGSEETDYLFRKKKPNQKPSTMDDSKDECSSVGLVTCHCSDEYINTLYNLLLPTDDTNLSRQLSVGGASGRGLKRGGASSQEIAKDIILKPKVIDLVDQSGPLEKLWAMGLKEVKVETIRSFGSSMMILLHAHIPNEASTKNNTPGKIVMKTKLR